MNKQKGISQIVVMVMMLVLAIALPITTKLVQQSQENRSKATGGCPNVFLATVNKVVPFNEGATWCDGGNVYKCFAGQTWSYNAGDSVDGQKGFNCPNGCNETTYLCNAAGTGGGSDPNICPAGGHNNYCATYTADYYNNLPEINGKRSIDIPGGSCSSGHCINCAPRVECDASNAGKNVSNGGDIASNGTGCSLRTCPPAYSCVTNGNYCTGSDNNDAAGIPASGDCPSGQKCVNCAPKETCTSVGQRVATGARINKDGSGCAKICTTNDINYTCTSKGYYCTASATISKFGQWLDSETCPSGQRCVTCASAETCTSVGQIVGTGGKPTSTGICYKTCTTNDINYTCTTNGGYCTGSDNSQIGIYIEKLAGTCASGETCVKCMTNNNKCVNDPQTNTFKMTTGAQISSTGTGCYTPCTPVNTVACTDEDNWTSVLSPTACPVTGQQTKTWTKVGTCEGGITHPSNETVSCTYNASDSVVNIKLAFAGVKKDNGKCAINWPVSLKMVDSSNNSIIDKVLSGTPKQTGSVNEKGEIVYDFSVTVANVPETGVSKSAFFLTGSKHISVKYGENNQKAWYSTLAGTLGLTRGTTNSYDFSGYPLLAGDVTGDTVGKPDGKINGQDFSYIKEKANALLSAAAAGTNVEGDINGDCQANAGDVGLIKQSLKEINGQTY